MALRTEERYEASAQEEDLKVVRECLHSDDWSKVPMDFAMVRNELIYLGQVVLVEIRIVISEKRRERVLTLAFEGHQGNVKTKERLRS